jgi:uncharacterized protein
MTARIQALYRYPVKGLSAESLDRVDLRAGEALPNDRRFAIAHGAARRLDPANPEWMPKGFFLQLMSNEKLATLQTRFEPETGLLTISRNGRQVSRGKITETTGRAVVEEFLTAYMGAQARGQPKLVECRGQPFSDTREPFISIINVATAMDLARVVGKPVDPMRFRGNILIEDAAAWSELDWVGKTLRIGDAVLRVEERTGRCAATNVDPRTGARDLTLPRSMQHAFGHEDCGVYARVIEAGTIAAGDEITIA